MMLTFVNYNPDNHLELQIAAYMRHDLYRDGWQPNRLAEKYGTLEALNAAMRKIQAVNAQYVFWAFLGEEIIGMGIVKDRGVDYQHDGGYVELIYISPLHRRKGYGKQLLDRCCDVLRDAGLHKAWLNTESESAANMAFYASQGWQADGVRSDYPMLAIWEKSLA